MLPLQIDEPPPAVESALISFKRVNEIIVVANALVVSIVASLTHVNYQFRVLLIMVASMSTLGIYTFPLNWGIPIVKHKSVQLLLIPLVLTVSALVTLQAIAHNVPGIAFYHTFMDFETPVPIIPMDVHADISFVIPTRDEDPEFVVKTIEFILAETPSRFIREIILVDDQSAVPVQQLVAEHFPDHNSTITVVRLHERKGLTPAKVIGAQHATGTHIMFLDAHCRVGPGYAERMLTRSSLGTFKDIIVPQVINVDGDSFAFTSMDGGFKMMFDWTFDFSWFGDDTDDFVPVSSGGIMLITRRFFMTGGMYDLGMLEWGGENIEQSLRCWQCGGRIIVDREAKVGHVFNRKLSPNRVSTTVVQRNYARAAFVWLDDSIGFFEAKQGSTHLTQLGPGIDERLALRHRLACKPFTAFQEVFARIFDQTSLDLNNQFSIQHVQSGLCLTVLPLTPDGKVKERPVKIEWEVCQRFSNAQRFAPVRGSTRVRHVQFERCLERQGNGNLDLVLCDFLFVNPAQNFVLSDRIGKLTSEIEAGNALRQTAYCLFGPFGSDVKSLIHASPKVAQCFSAADSSQVEVKKLYLGI